jgi:hypothetical protein
MPWLRPKNVMLDVSVDSFARQFCLKELIAHNPSDRALTKTRFGRVELLQALSENSTDYGQVQKLMCHEIRLDL